MVELSQLETGLADKTSKSKPLGFKSKSSKNGLKSKSAEELKNKQDQDYQGHG